MLVDHIKAAQVAAMKGQKALELSVLRMLLSAINYKRIDLQRELTDEDVLTVAQAEAKKRREAIDSYTKANRQDQVDKEQQELEILQAYLPKQLSEKEIEIEIAKLDLPTDFGQAMRMVSPLFRGKAEGAMVAKIVKEKIGNG